MEDKYYKELVKLRMESAIERMRESAAEMPNMTLEEINAAREDRGR